MRAVYDVLADHGVFATKTVWAFPPEEPCGIPALPASIQRGVTLADSDYRRYCTELGLTRRFVAQSSIILSEVLFRGRTLDSNRWLGSEDIRLENHDAW